MILSLCILFLALLAPVTVSNLATQIGLVVKELPANVGHVRHMGSIPGLGRSPGGGHGNALQYSLLQNSHGHRCLAGYSPWDGKELDMTE